MRRFFVNDIGPENGRATISGAEFMHLKKVLRLAVGDRAAVFDGQGNEAVGVIESIGPSFAVVSIESRSSGKGEGPVKITLFQGLMKGDKNEFVIQKATELGASSIAFYESNRTVARFKEERAAERLERWRKVAIDAAKQCGRTVVPSIGAVAAFPAAIRGAEKGERIFLWEGEGTRGLKGHLRACAGVKEAALLIGPEGGLSPDDAKEAVAAGFTAFSLGKRILRAETAAVAALSIVQYELGDIG